MADNVTVTAGTGTTVHADEYTHSILGSGKTQLVKLVDGTLDSSTGLYAGNGVAANAMRVTLASDGTGIVALTTGSAAIGKLTANTGVTIGAVEIAAAQTLATVTTVSTVTAIGTSVTPGTGAAHLGKAEDAAHASGDTGVAVWAVRKDTATALAGTDGDYAPIEVDSSGRLHVIEPSAAASAASVATTATNTTTIATNTTSLAAGLNAQGAMRVQLEKVDGTDVDPTPSVAHDAVDSGGSVKIGARAIAGISTATLVADADRTDMFAGKDGVLIVRQHCGLEDIVSAVVACTAGANTSGIAAQGAGIKVYLTQVIAYNNGASNGSIIVTDGSGGTTKAKLPFPASTGAVFTLPVPIGFTANTAIFVDPSGSDTIDVTLIGFKSKV